MNRKIFKKMNQGLTRWVVGLSGAVGGVLALVAPKGSGAQTVGSMLLLGSLMIGSFVLLYFAKKRAPLVSEPPSFSPTAEFVPHFIASLSPVADCNEDALYSEIGGPRFFLLIGSEGHSARFRARPQSEDGKVEVQLLKPELAGEFFSAGASFNVFDGSRVLAKGEVLDGPLPTDGSMASSRVVTDSRVVSN